MIQENNIILHQLKITLTLLQDFKEEIKVIKFKGFPMGNLTKVHITPKDSNKVLYMNKQARYKSGVVSLLYIVNN